MKKIALILLLTLLSFKGFSQYPGLFTFVISRDSICLGDSCVSYIMPDTLPNTDWVRALIASNFTFTDGLINNGGIVGLDPDGTLPADISWTFNDDFAMYGNSLQFEMNDEHIQHSAEGSLGQYTLIYLDTLTLITLQAYGTTGAEGSYLNIDSNTVEIGFDDTVDPPKYIFRKDSISVDTFPNVESENQVYWNPVTKILTASEITHGYMYFEDSVITVNLVDDTWTKVSNSYDSIFVIPELEHITYIKGDTLQINVTGHIKWFPELNFYGDAGENFEMEIYNITQAYPVPSRKYNEGSGGADRAPIGGGVSYDTECVSGDKYILRWRNVDGGDTGAELLSGSIYIELTHTE